MKHAAVAIDYTLDPRDYINNNNNNAYFLQINDNGIDWKTFVISLTVKSVFRPINNIYSLTSK